MKKVSEKHKRSLADLSFKERVLEEESMVETAQEYDEMDFVQSNNLFADFLAQLIAPKSLVIDYGCGPGDITVELAKRRNDLLIIGVDLSPMMLEIAADKARTAGAQNRITWMHGDMTKPVLPDSYRGNISFAFSHTSLHHVPDLDPFFREMMAVLSPHAGFCFRDLRRPRSAAEAMQWIAKATRDNLTRRQYNLFFNSLRASLTLEEVEAVATATGITEKPYIPESSNRYWVLARPTR